MHYYRALPRTSGRSGLGVGGNDRWSQESNIPTLVFTFQMDQDDALQILTLLISLSQSQDILSRKEMFIFHLHPVQRVNDRLSLTALLSTFLTPLIRFYLEEGCSYPIRKLGCACASPCLGVCLDCIKVSQLTNDHNDDDGPPPPSASASDRV